VSTTETLSYQIENRVTVIGHNPAHERRLIATLVEHYGWELAKDGNLYSRNPKLSAAWRKVG
jgi:hypothetical protein